MERREWSRKKGEVKGVKERERGHIGERGDEMPPTSPCWSPICTYIYVKNSFYYWFCFGLFFIVISPCYILSGYIYFCGCSKIIDLQVAIVFSGSFCPQDNFNNWAIKEHYCEFSQCISAIFPIVIQKWWPQGEKMKNCSQALSNLLAPCGSLGVWLFLIAGEMSMCWAMQKWEGSKLSRPSIPPWLLCFKQAFWLLCVCKTHACRADTWPLTQNNSCAISWKLLRLLEQNLSGTCQLPSHCLPESCMTMWKGAQKPSQPFFPVTYDKA